MKPNLQIFQQKTGIDLSLGKTLLALSGGVDSVALFYLLLEAKYPFEVAHVNFGLRGEESKADEIFVKNLCSKYNIPCHIHLANTLEYAKQNRQSIQIAARDIRYHYFDKIATERNCNYIATAHHLNDALENLFIYLIRNNHAAAFSGIEPVNDKIIRPLVYFTRDCIKSYVLSNQMQWREDISNVKNNYLRNKIRNRLLPAIIDNYPNIEEEYSVLSESYRHYQKTQQRKYDFWINSNLQKIKHTAFELRRESINIDTDFAFIIRYFRSLGFHRNTAEEIAKNTVSGKQFFVDKVVVTVNRNAWHIAETEGLECPQETPIFIENLPEIVYFGNHQLHFKLTEKVELPLNQSNAYFFDADKLEFPIICRGRKTGDKMKIFGMQGTKKISDILVNAKVNSTEKDGIAVIADSTDILAVAGIKRSSKAAIVAQTKSVLQIKWYAIEGETI